MVATSFYISMREISTGGMTSAVGIENRRWTVKLQYEMSLGKESKNDNIGVNYNSLTLSVGYKLNVKQ